MLQHIEISVPKDINLSFSGQLAHSTAFYSGCGQLNVSQICHNVWMLGAAAAAADADADADADDDDDDDDDDDVVFLWCSSCYTEPVKCKDFEQHPPMSQSG